jgi:CRISPR/Cas system-associated exonuclease Cas4 (RecB family)
VRAYCDLRARAAEFIRNSAADGPVLVLAPVRTAADEAARFACGAALVGVQRMGFRDLVLELASAELNRRGLVPVGRVVREALAARVAAATDLSYFGPVASFPGFPRALTDTFEELRLNAVDPERLRECGESGADLARLLEAYTRELTTRGFADHAARVTLARPEMAGSAVVTLDLAPRTLLEKQLLGRVLDSARAVLDLRLESAGQEACATSLQSVQRHLFSSEPVPAREEDGTLHIFSTSGEALECIEIARQIHAAAAEGVPFDEMAILLRSLERHQPLVLEALRRGGIPAYCSLGAVRPDAAGRSFLALLVCAEEGLSASRFAEYLSLGQFKEEEEPPTPAVWERMLVDAAVIGGPERWKTRLAGLRQEFHRRYREEPDEGEREALDRRIAQLENLERIALPLIGKLAELPRRALWGEWIDALTGLAEFALREPDRLIDLLDQLEPMAPIGPVSLAEVLLVLGPRLNSLRSEPKGSRYGKVWIGAIEDARGLAFRRVFVPGVNEGLFPRPPAEDPLLLEAQREALGIELRAEDTELLRIAAAGASERLILSYSRLDLLTGRERVPSFYVFEAHRAAGGREMAVREFEDRARSQTSTRIGWPAPKDAAEAIDDAEFDLATMAPLVKGSGQYLKGVPGRAVQSLRARWIRWHKPWKAADGLLIDSIGSDDMAPYGLGARAWSPTLLQQYARCPYRFALRGIFGLRPQEQPSAIQRLDPAARGRIFHDAQFAFLAGGGFESPDPLDRLDAALNEIAARAEADLAPAIPQIWRAEIDALRADLRGWLQQKLQDRDWTPEYFELSFGLNDPAGRDPRSRTEPVTIDGGFLLQGSIDVVERHAGGIRRVIDHKTGRIPEPRPEMLGGGEVLQPALYALAAEKILGEPAAFGRLHYATIAQNYTTIDVHLNQWTRQRTAQALRVIDDAVRDGFLPAAPRKDGCKRCEYLPVCGPYEEERAHEKSQAELKPLKDLRGWR